MSTLALFVNDQGALVKVVNGQEIPCSRAYSEEVADLILARQGHVMKTLSRDGKTLPTFSKSLFRDLRRRGLSKEDIMTVSGELLRLVAEEIKDERGK
jgi:hypothetical protein